MDTYRDRLKHAMALDRPTKQTELAAAIGVTKATINSLMKGRSEALNAPNSEAAAKFLKVDHRWLATGEGEPRPLLMMERLALSAKAVYIGGLLDAIEDPDRRASAYALIVQMLEFSAPPPARH